MKNYKIYNFNANLMQGSLKSILLWILLLGVCSTSSASAEQLAKIIENNLQINVSAESDGVELAINHNAGFKRDYQPNIFTLENPSRVVIDLPDVLSKSARNVVIKHSLISNLRLGVHNDKTRLVVDVRNSEEPKFAYATSADGKTLRVQLVFAKNSESQVAQEDPPKPTAITIVNPTKEIESPKLVERNQPKVNPPQSLADYASRTSEPSSPPAIDDKTRANQADTITMIANKRLEMLNKASDQSPKADIAIIRGLFFQTSETANQPALMIDVEGLKNYTLRPGKDNVFELILESALLEGPHLSYPQFPPDTFSGFESVVAQQKDENVVLRIFVEKDVTLLPFVAQGKLWVKTK